MSVDLVEIGDRNIEYPDHTKQEFLSSDEYLTIARKLIATIAPRFRTGLAKEILQSEDAVSNIATQLMFGDWRWDGNGTRQGYRKQCAEWAIKAYIGRASKRWKNNCLSLNYLLESDQELSDLIPDDKQVRPDSAVSEQEEKSREVRLIDKLLATGVLSAQQERCIRMNYLEDMSLVDVGKHLGISRQGVQDHIKRGLNTLRNIANGNTS
jgi:RNA polymerase sigma factor (sigma-70 family)